MCNTWSKKYLEYHGPYPLRIIKKDYYSPAREHESMPIFLVETEDQRYQGILEVNLIDYKKYRAGEIYLLGGVIHNTQKDNCYYMTKYDDPKVAIRKAVNWSRIRFVFLGIVILMFVDTIVLFTLPLFR